MKSSGPLLLLNSTSFYDVTNLGSCATHSRASGQRTFCEGTSGWVIEAGGAKVGRRHVTGETVKVLGGHALLGIPLPSAAVEQPAVDASVPTAERLLPGHAVEGPGNSRAADGVGAVVGSTPATSSIVSVDPRLHAHVIAAHRQSSVHLVVATALSGSKRFVTNVVYLISAANAVEVIVHDQGLVVRVVATATGKVTQLSFAGYNSRNDGVVEDPCTTASRGVRIVGGSPATRGPLEVVFAELALTAYLLAGGVGKVDTASASRLCGCKDESKCCLSKSPDCSLLCYTIAFQKN